MANGHYNQLVWIDIESTGLVIGHHEPFEIHLIKGQLEKTIWLDVDVSKADPGALKVNHFYKRRADGYRLHRMEHADAAALIADWTTDCTIAGNNVGRFDTGMIEAFLRKNGLVPAWSHRVIDSIDYAAGALGLAFPWSSRSVAAALGIPEQTEEEAHTAPADARWAKAIYEKALQIGTKEAVAKRIEPTVAQLIKGKVQDEAATASQWSAVIGQAALFVQPKPPTPPGPKADQARGHAELPQSENGRGPASVAHILAAAKAA